MTKEFKKELSKRKTKEMVAKETAAEYEYDHELLTGKFINLEHKGQSLNFRFKKYRQDDYKQYCLVDGYTYTLPRMVVEHIKNHVYYRSYKPLIGLKGDLEVKAMVNDGGFKSEQHMMEVEKDHRCDFIPLDFTENDRMLRERNKVVEVAQVAL